MKKVWKVLLWSFYFLWLGTHPTFDHDHVPWNAETHPAECALQGQPLAAGHFAVLWLIKGDLEYFAKNLGLRHFNSIDLCDFCAASRHGPESMWPTNFVATAEWKRRLTSGPQWRLQNPDMHHIFAHFPFLTNQNVAPDELHIAHLGTSMYMLGSALFLLAYRKLAGSPEDNMRRIWALICEFYTANASTNQYSNLLLSFFTDPANPGQHYPKLKGRGGEVKHLGPAVLYAWVQLIAEQSEQDQWVISALQAQCRISEVLDEDSHALFLTPQSWASLIGAIDQFLLHYNRLARWADMNDLLLFNAPAKFHWLWHFGQAAKYSHPRRGACWIDEEFVGQIKNVARRCSAGTKLHAIANKVLEKHTFGTHILHATM